MKQLSAAAVPRAPFAMPVAPMPSAAVKLLRTFARHGVDVAYGIPGGSASPLFDGLAEVPEISFVSTRHEAMAGFAAMGHARQTGLPALVMTTSGPGLTNAITGIAAASLEGIPMIVLAGEVAWGATQRGALQDGSPAGLDVVSTLRSTSRWVTTLGSAAGAAGTAERAWQLATTGRPGPVVIAVPLDVGGHPAGGTIVPAMPAPPPVPDREACRDAARMLGDARRPLLVLGNGARSAHREALLLAERLAIPVAVTGHGKGIFPERHPLYLGLVGVGQHPTVLEYLAEPPDVVCIVGSRLGDLATNGWTLPLGGTTATIQIDHEPWLIGRNVPVTLGIVGDAALALSSMSASLPRDVGVPRRSTPGCRSLRADLATSDAVPLKPQRVFAALSAAFPDAIFCSDIGEHLTLALHYLRVDGPDRFQAMAGLGSMGSGIGAAIGAKRARPDRTVVAICGDGGLAMHAGEILSCVESEIAVIFAVFNDGRWNMIHHGFSTVYGRVPPAMPSRVADLAGVAAAFGARSAIVRTPADLSAEALHAHRASRTPTVLDIRIDPSESLTAESRAAAIRHFSAAPPRLPATTFYVSSTPAPVS
jgi:acetolactate synthase-1/2/3 large subunit